MGLGRRISEPRSRIAEDQGRGVICRTSLVANPMAGEQHLSRESGEIARTPIRIPRCLRWFRSPRFWTGKAKSSCGR